MIHKFGARSSNAAIKAAATWPVTGHDFQKTKRPAVRYFFQ